MPAALALFAVPALFAEGEPSVPWWWIAIAGAAGPAVKWGWDAVTGWHKGQQQHEREIKREALDEAYKLIDRQAADILKADAKIDSLNVRCNRMEVKYERAVAWIEYVQDVLKRANPPVYVAPFKNPDDTGDHAPLPSEADRG